MYYRFRTKKEQLTKLFKDVYLKGSGAGVLERTFSANASSMTRASCESVMRMTCFATTPPLPSGKALAVVDPTAKIVDWSRVQS